MYTIKNANILNDKFEFEKNDLQIDNGKIIKIGSDLSGGEVIDANGAYVFPGLVNIHTHGAMGYDTIGCGYEGINEMSKLWAKTGTTSFMPTMVTALRDDACKAAEDVASAIDKGTEGASVVSGMNNVNNKFDEIESIGDMKDEENGIKIHILRRKATDVKETIQGNCSFTCKSY